MQCFSYLSGYEKPIHSIRQIVVREDEVRSQTTMDDQFLRRGAIGSCCWAMALLLEDYLEEFAQFSVVLDDQNRAGTASRVARLTISSDQKLSNVARSVRREHDVDGKDRSSVRLRANMDRMAKQARQALNNG